MSWTAPRTWTPGEIVTAALLNTHIRDNEIDIDSRLDALETAGAVMLVGQDATERSTTSTSPATLSSVSGLSIPVTSGIRVIVSFLKTTGAAAKATLAIGLTSSGQVGHLTDATDSANSAGSGIAVVDFAPYGASYDNASGGQSYFKNAASTYTSAVWHAANGRPNSAITAVTVSGWVSSASITLKTNNLKVYELP